MNPPATTVAYFGPAATFTQEALLTQPDLAGADLRSLGSITAVLEAVARGDVDLGFVPIENAIEGTVSATIDGLIHDVDLYIQREVVMDIHLHLMARPGTGLARDPPVSSYPHALAQCQKYLARALPEVEQRAANSTADAARRARGVRLGRRGGHRPPSGRRTLRPGHRHRGRGGPPRQPDPLRRWSPARRVPKADRATTRRASCASSGPTTREACTASSGQFAARNINLTKLESRPTKQGLGDYCFVIDLIGHVGDEVVADCLRDLHAGLAGVKFLGSYPAAGEHGPDSGGRPTRPGRRPTTGCADCGVSIE